MAQQYDVTSVGVNPTEDRAHRMRVYFIAMTIRVACVASLFFVRGWWILLVGIAAVVLPYFAVLIANQADHSSGQAPEAPTPLELTGGGTGQQDPESDAADSSADTLLVVDVEPERRAREEPS